MVHMGKVSFLRFLLSSSLPWNYIIRQVLVFLWFFTSSPLFQNLLSPQKTYDAVGDEKFSMWLRWYYFHLRSLYFQRILTAYVPLSVGFQQKNRLDDVSIHFNSNMNVLSAVVILKSFSRSMNIEWSIILTSVKSLSSSVEYWLVCIDNSVFLAWPFV